MKYPKISVIVAVYNTELFVEKCLKSLINQTYKNLEIIVVEDGSTDNSKKVLKKYSTNCNIKIIYNKKNMGLSYSRNIGLKNATGSYIGYIDSDDYVDDYYYERLMQSILDNQAQIAVCDIKIVYDKTQMQQLSRCYSDGDFNLYNVINNGLAASACNKLFERKLIEKYSFSVGKVNEDIAVIIPALVNASKICYTPNCYYYYVQRNSSIQNSNFSDRRFDIFDGVSLTLERIKGCENFFDIKDALVFNQLICLFIYVIPKEKNIFRRRKILKKFAILSKEYEIRKNHCFWKFLEVSGRKHQIYYRLLFYFLCTRKYTLANLLILSYDILYLLLKKKSVVNMDVDLKTIIELARGQHDMSDAKVRVSVVIPNYNYARFMYQRLYSILCQDYKIYELIILDDCSSDDSRKVIDNIVSDIGKYVDIKVMYNDVNSGTAFKQWKKGFDAATGDYIWIAEADDYCESSLLSSLIKPCLHDDDIVISYSDTAFIDVMGNITIKSIKSEIDIMKTGHWNKSFVNDGINEVENYAFLNCTIANVSSCIIKNGDYSNLLQESCNYKQAGDWVFYVNLMKFGKVAFINKPLNYYRVHGENVSSTMNRKKHIDEILKIHNKIKKEFNITDFHNCGMEKRIDFLKKAWKVD